MTIYQRMRSTLLAVALFVLLVALLTGAACWASLPDAELLMRPYP